MRGYEHVGERIRERLVALGYVRPDGDADVVRFSFDYRFDKTHLYAWLRNTMTPFKDLIRLCTALQCSVEWLLTGKEREMGKAHPRQGRGVGRKLLLACSLGAVLWPSGGVAAQGRTLQVGGTTDKSDMVDYVKRRRRRFRNYSRYLGMARAA